MFFALAACAAAQAWPDREVFEFPVSRVSSSPAALVVDFGPAAPSSADHAAFRAATFHLKSRGGWWGAERPVSGIRGTLRIPFASFSPEGDPGPVDASTVLRVSLWRRPSRRPEAPLVSSLSALGHSAGVAVLAGPASVAVVSPSGETAPGETEFAARMLGRAERLLERAGVEFDVLPDSVLRSSRRNAAAALAPYRAVVLPFNPRLSARVSEALAAFSGHGGRIVAFYNADPELSAILGLAPPRWEKSECSGMVVKDGRKRPENAARFPHPTDNLMCPVVRDSSARVLATWLDSSGRDTGRTAVASTPAGALFAHVPPLAFPAARELVREALGLEAGGGRTAADREDGPDAAARDPLSALRSRIETGGVRLAAWAPHAATPEFLARAAARAPFVSEVFLRPDQVFAPPPENRNLRFSLYFPVLFDPSGGGAWLDPRNPADRSRVLDALRASLSAFRSACTAAGGGKAASAPGIHLDYVRSGETASPETTAAVTALVREIAAAAREEFPGAEISAAVFPTPEAAAARNQDWPAWIAEGLADFICPMVYEDDPAAFSAALASCLGAAPAGKVLPGVGNGADESQPDAAAIAGEVLFALDSGCPGAAFFPLDFSVPQFVRTPRDRPPRQ